MSPDNERLEQIYDSLSNELRIFYHSLRNSSFSREDAISMIIACLSRPDTLEKLKASHDQVVIDMSAKIDALYLED